MLIAYIYDQTDSIVAQFFSVSDFQCRTVLHDIGTASFTLDPTESWISYAYLKEFTRCKIAYAENGVESILFDGVIRKTVSIQDGIQVTLNDFLYLLKKKKVYGEKLYSWIPVNTILSGILWEINARYNSRISLDTTESWVISKTYKNLTSYFDALRDLALSGYEFLIKNKIIYFAQKVWVDRTVDPNFVEFRSDILVPSEINISEYSILRDAENLSNWPTASDGTNWYTSSDSASISNFGRIEEIYSVDGDVSNASTKILSERKDGVSEISVTPTVEDFSVVDIGDTVKIYINGGNDMQFYDGSMRVIEKSLRFSGAIQTIMVGLSVNKVSTPTLLDTIKTLNERVKKIEI